MRKFKMHLGIGLCGCTRSNEITLEELGFTEEEWAELSEADRDDILEDELNGWMWNYIDSSIWEVEE